MTIYNVFSIRDRALDNYGPPFCAPSIPAAIRGFGDAVRRPDPDNMMRRHPEDFDLYHLGQYDDSTAAYKLLERPRQVAIGHEQISDSQSHQGLKP